MTGDRIARVMRAVLWAVLVAYAVLVVRDFYQYADRSVYLALDDGLANQAYVLSTHGRWGFLSSPTLYGAPRHFGEVSYGPWFYYLAGALSWVFGFSLTLVRSVHLWIIVGIVVVGARWFPGPRRVVAAGVLGLMALYCFNVGMWPMARPDSMVSAFGVALVVLAGAGFRTGQARYWFGAGLAASCGGFAHLIAWSLVPSCLAMFALWAIGRLRADPADRAARRAVALAFAGVAAGGILGAVMFYGSFQFRIADQLKMFDAYAVVIKSSDGYWAVFAKHFTTAFDYLPPRDRWFVGGSLALAWVTILAALRARADLGRVVVVYLLPPALVWTGYLVSGGFYTNHHKGYAILHQVLASWTAAALLWTWLELLMLRQRRLAGWAALLVAIALVGEGGRLIAWHLQQEPLRREHAESWVSITDFTRRLLAPIPAGGTAWGPVMYGIETPDRIQLVQVTEGAVLLPRVPDALKSQLSPEFLLWGYSEARDNALAVVAGGQSLLNQVGDLLAPARYRLASIVAATPYGINRVYARVDAGAANDSALPQVSIYDAPTRRWISRIGPSSGEPFVPTSPADLRVAYTDGTPVNRATSSVVADLPAGNYLLRVSIRPGDGYTRHRMLVATPASRISQTISELGPDGDFAGYWSDQTTVILLSLHPGGPLYVSQLDDGPGAALEAVEVFPVLGLTNPEERLPLEAESHVLPGDWQALEGVRASGEADGRQRFDGDGSVGGYQVMTPAIGAAAGEPVTVSLDVAVEQGGVCTGILNGTQSTWLVPPDQLRSTLSFRVDGTGRFYVIVANCNRSPGPWPESRFSIGEGRYRVSPGEFYTDRLMTAVFGDDLKGPR